MEDNGDNGYFAPRGRSQNGWLKRPSCLLFGRAASVSKCRRKGKGHRRCHGQWRWGFKYAFLMCCWHSGCLIWSLIVKVLKHERILLVFKDAVSDWMGSSSPRKRGCGPWNQWTRMLCSYLLLLCSCLFLTAVYLGTKGLVHSERELLESSVLHPLFNTEADWICGLFVFTCFPLFIFAGTTHPPKTTATSKRPNPIKTRDWTHQIWLIISHHTCMPTG